MYARKGSGNNTMTKRISTCGMLAALAIIMSYVEMLIPIDFAVPGIKLGLANVVVLFMIEKGMNREAFCINLIRICVTGFMFGNFNSIVFSLAGGLASFAIMYFLNKTKLNICIISVNGAVAHVIAQLFIGLLWYPVKALIYYSLFLVVAAIITGFLLGIVVNNVLIYLVRIYEK